MTINYIRDSWRKLSAEDSARIKCQGAGRARHSCDGRNPAAWCNTWQTSAMSAPSFFYTCDECKESFLKFRRGESNA